MEKEERGKIIVRLMKNSFFVGLAIGFALGAIYALGHEQDLGTILNHSGQTVWIAVGVLLLGFILALRLDKEHTKFLDRL